MPYPWFWEKNNFLLRKFVTSWFLRWSIHFQREILCFTSTPEISE